MRGRSRGITPLNALEDVLHGQPERRTSMMGRLSSEDEMAAAQRWWLIGQLIAVVLIALTTWAGLGLIGMPGAFLLGMQAGLVNFIIPYLGPLIAAVPITLVWAAHLATSIQRPNFFTMRYPKAMQRGSLTSVS